MNNAPPLNVVELSVKVDLSTLILSPVIVIEPPFEVEVPELIPLLLVQVILYILP